MTAPALLEAVVDLATLPCPAYAEAPRVLPLEQLELLIRAHPSVLTPDDFALVHTFAPGVYVRQITMRAGLLVLGRKHRTRHVNIISKGRVAFRVPGEPVHVVDAPYTFVSEAGVQKLLYIHEETVWTTVHPTEETDLTKLEALLIEPHVNPYLRLLDDGEDAPQEAA